MENSEIVKRLSLLEDQRELLLSSFKTASGIANGTITGGQDGTWIETPKKQGNNINRYLFSREDDSNSYSSETGSQAEYEEVPIEKLTLPTNMVNAEDTFVENMTWSALELRVHHLEKSVYGFDPITKKPVVHDKLKYTMSLLKHIDEIKKQFQTIIRERDGLKTFFEQYEQLSPYVSPFRDAVDLERAVLTPEAKAEIIVASEESLKNVAENLKQIEELQGVIDAEEFKGLEKLFPLVTPIEALHVKQSAQSIEVSARINQLMDRYNGIVNTLSEIFIAWDSILTTIEANIASLEREKARS